MERVKKGERYWFISELFMVEARYESNNIMDAELFKANNYFPASLYTPKMVEEMAAKLRTVLKGADVIEMPSEEEIKAQQDRIEDEVVFNIRDNSGMQLIYCTAINKSAELMADWLKTKIVK